MTGSFEAVVNCTYRPSEAVLLANGFESFHVQELVIGSSDPERHGLGLRRKLRLLSTHTQETPIFFHMVKTDSKSVSDVIDQMADVGLEMMIYSFGADFNMESNDTDYLKRIASNIAYANSKGIEVGGYDLIVWTRKVQNNWMAVGGKGACIASGWYDYLLARVVNFIDSTNLSMVETDGPYPRYTCSSKTHPHHLGLQDSVYWQLKLQSKFYRNLREKEVYINQPDGYFYQGGSRTGSLILP